MRGARIAAAALVAAALAAGCAPRAVRPPLQVAIRWGGDAGTVRRYALEQAFRGRIGMAGMPQLMVVKARAVLEDRVEEVTAEGWRRIVLALKFEPIEVNGMALEMGSFPREVAIPMMRSPSGEVNELEQRRDMGDALAWAARSAGAIIPLLPPTAVSPGEAWRTERTLTVSGTGRLLQVSLGTFEGVETVDGERVARLKLEGGVNLEERAEGSTIESFRIEYRGVARFLLDEGRVLDSTQEGRIDMKGTMNTTPIEAGLLFSTVLRPAAASATPATP